MPLPGPRAPIITDVSPPAGGQAILVGIGGVLAPSVRPAAATYWGSRLGMPPAAFLGALFGGSDDQVLTGRVSEPAGGTSWPAGWPPSRAPRCSSTTPPVTWPRLGRSA